MRIASNIAKLPTTRQNKNRCGCLGSNAYEVGKNSQKIGSGRQGRHRLEPPCSRHHGNSGASPRIESNPLEKPRSRSAGLPRFQGGTLVTGGGARHQLVLSYNPGGASLVAVASEVTRKESPSILPPGRSLGRSDWIYGADHDDWPCALHGLSSATSQSCRCC